MVLPFKTIIEDLDICAHLGEKISKSDEGYIWKQVDITSMKEEKKRMSIMRKEMKIQENPKLIMSMDGKEHEIGEINIYNRKPIAISDNGKVQLLYHGNNEALNIYVMNIIKDGEFIIELNDQKMVYLI